MGSYWGAPLFGSFRGPGLIEIDDGDPHNEGPERGGDESGVYIVDPYSNPNPIQPLNP